MLTEPSVVKFPSVRMGSKVTSYKRGKMSRGSRRSSPARPDLLADDDVAAAVEAANIAINIRSNDRWFIFLNSRSVSRTHERFNLE